MKNLFKKSLLVIMAGAMVCTTSCNTVKSDNQNKSADNSQPEETTSKSDTIDETAQPKEEITLTMLMAGDTTIINDTIEEFNNANNGYRVEIKRINDQTDENGEPVVNPLEDARQNDFFAIQDIINTDKYDIITDVSFMDMSYYEILQQKGAFADLYSFMENDSEVNKDTLNSHILNLNETEGKLYTVPMFYGIETLCGESQYVGTKENWTFDEFADYWDKMPDSTTFFGSREKENIYRFVFVRNLSSFVDYENTQVHFDSPDFRRILEFCNQFESKGGEKGNNDYEAVSFVKPCLSDSIMSSATFDQKNGTTLVGYPSENGNGAFLQSAGLCYSICASSSSEKQKGAWEFIRTFLTEQWQVENVIPQISGDSNTESHYSSELGFCVNQKAFDTIAEKLINKEYYSATFENKGEEFERRFPTAEEVDALKNYILTVNRWDTVLNISLQDIVQEEVTTYFNGEISIDECINNIQNRGAIWISEQG